MKSPCLVSGHDGVGAGVGDPPHPPSLVGGQKATRGGKGGGRDRQRKGVCEATKNIALRKSVEEYGSQKIKFEWNDQKMFLHVGKNHAWWSNSVVELVREFLMHYPSWLDIDKSKKAHINGGIMHHLNLRIHMRSPRWPDIEKGIEQYFVKRYFDKKHNLKRDYWNVKAGETCDAEAIRSRPPPNMERSDWEAHITFWLDLKHASKAAENAKNRARKTIFSCQGSRLLDVLQEQQHGSARAMRGDDQPEGSQSRYAYRGAYTEEQILAMVIKGNERGHIPGKGRHVAGLGKTLIFGSQTRGMYSRAKIDDMLAKRDKALAATKEEANPKAERSDC
ncbi:hypothetical protein Tco_0184549 [Tanacetum coccineum]